MSDKTRDLFSTGEDLHRFTKEEIDAIHGVGDTRKCAPGEVIVRKGDTGDCMFVLVEGEVEIDLGDDRTKVLEAGSFFGELSFINPDHQRSGTVRSRGETRLFQLGPEAAEALIEKAPRAFLSLIRRTCAALVDSEEKLISELRQKNHELERTLDFLVRTREELDYQELLARTDELTGLYNRRCFQDQLEKYVARGAGGDGRGLAVIMVDLDGFKPVNDRLGHAAGDVVLKNVGRILKESVRRSDLPCRLGGDEFAVLLTDVSSDAARMRAEGIRQSIAELPPVDPDVDLTVTASMGGTMYQPDEAPANFLERADKDLYKAKEEGRNRLVWQGEPVS